MERNASVVYVRHIPIGAKTPFRPMTLPVFRQTRKRVKAEKPGVGMLEIIDKPPQAVAFPNAELKEQHWLLQQAVRHIIPKHMAGEIAVRLYASALQLRLEF